MNALKHGLTAATALPGEDPALVAAELEAAQADYAPTTRLGAKLIRRAAILSIRLDRCERFIQATDERRIRHALATHDHNRAETAARLLDAIEGNPAPYRRALLATPEGVDRLIDALGMLLGDLAAPTSTWTWAHHRRLDAVFGFRVDDLPRHRPTRFSRALLGDFMSIGPDELADVPDADRADWALLQLAEAIEAEIQSLIAHRATLDHAALAADRAAAPDLALFDADRPSELARRYEQATYRELSRVLGDFHRAEAAAAPVLAAEPPAPAAESAPTGPIANDPKPNSNNEFRPMASFREPLPEVADTPTGRPAAGPVVAPRAVMTPHNPPATG